MMIIVGMSLLLSDISAAEGSTPNTTFSEVELASIRKDLAFIQANLKPDEIKKLQTELAMTQGDRDAINKCVIVYKERLKGRGVTPENSGGGAFVDNRPKIDLSKYAVLDLPKQADWIPSPADDREGKGSYREESLNAQVVQTKVGIWELRDSGSGRISKVCFNNQGIEIGPKWTYYESAGGAPAQVSQIQVIYGCALDTVIDGLEITKISRKDIGRLKARPGELLKFHKNGTLAMWTRPEEGHVWKSQSWSESGQATEESSLTLSGEITIKHLYMNGGAKDWTNVRCGNAAGVYTDMSHTYIHKEWSGNGDILSLNITDAHAKYLFPKRDGSTPPDAKQTVIWADEKDEQKGVKAAGFIVGEPPGIKNGPWVEYNARGSALTSGSYKDGKQEGEWTEREFSPSNTIIADRKGRYGNGLKVGIWQTDYASSHPDVQSAAGRAKGQGDGRTHLNPVGMGIVEGHTFRQTDTYVDGQISKTERNFKP